MVNLYLPANLRYEDDFSEAFSGSLDAPAAPATQNAVPQPGDDLRSAVDGGMGAGVVDNTAAPGPAPANDAGPPAPAAKPLDLSNTALRNTMLGPVPPTPDAAPYKAAQAAEDTMRTQVGANLDEGAAARKNLVNKFTLLQNDRPTPPSLAGLEPKAAPTYTPDSPLENFGSFATVLGIMGGMLTRQPLTASLNAAAGAMNAYHERNIEDYRLRVDQWRNESQHLQDLMKYRIDGYNLALDKFKGDEAAITRQFDLIGALTQDDQMRLALKTGDAATKYKVYNDQVQAADKYRDQRMRLEQFFEIKRHNLMTERSQFDDPGQMMVRENARRAAANQPPMNAQEEQDFLKIINANRYGLGSRGGGSAAAVLAQQKQAAVDARIAEINADNVKNDKPPLDTTGQLAVRQEVERAFRVQNPTWGSEKVALLNAWRAAWAKDHKGEPPPDELVEKKFKELDQHGAAAADTKWKSQKELYDALVAEFKAKPENAGRDPLPADQIAMQQRAASAFSAAGMAAMRFNDLVEQTKEAKLQEKRDRGDMTPLSPQEIGDIQRWVSSTASTSSKPPEPKYNEATGQITTPQFPGAPGAPSAAAPPASAPVEPAAPGPPSAAAQPSAQPSTGAIPTEKPRSSMPPGVDLTQGTGMLSFLQSHLNTIIDALGMPMPSAETKDAVTALNRLQKQTEITLQDAVPGKPSNYLMKELKSLTVDPGALLSGDSGALKTFQETSKMVQQGINELTTIINNPAAGGYTRKQVTEARIKRESLRALANDYEYVIENYSMRAGAPGKKKSIDAYFR